jgi:NADPH2:quinone reductase
VLTGLTVIATASRPETVDWVRRLGAHHVVDHSKPLAPQLGLPAVDIVVVFGATKAHGSEVGEIVAPQGHIGLIEGPDGFGPEELARISQKSAALHFELMFTRPRLGTPDMIRQHDILDAAAALVDEGKLRTTLTQRLSPINAATLHQAHAAVEGGRMIGKVVVEGWAT